MDRRTVLIRELNVPLVGLECPAGGLRIVHVSDFHFWRWNRVLAETQRLLMTLDYDLLAVTGDFSVRPGDWICAASMCRRFFARLHPPLGMYAVLGNHDDRKLGRQPNLPFRLLENESVRLEVNGSSLVLAGVNQCVNESGDVSAALCGVPPSVPVIMLAHYPSTVYRVPGNRVGLLLSGHTHGGQIRLPLLGCVWTNDRIPVSMARGLHRVGSTMLHVSAGIGVSPPIRMRYRCPPELSMITLESPDREVANTPGAVSNDRKLRSLERLAAGV